MRERQVPSLAVPLVLAGLLLAARIVSVPALHDPVAGSAPASAYLNIPPTYLILAPLFTLWDGVSMLSMRRLIGFLTGLAVLYLLGRVAGAIRRRHRADRRPMRSQVVREVVVLVASVALLLGFIVVGLVWHRPMLSLGGTHPDEAVVDFHSHTNVSHDVRDTWMRGFDREANLRWHARAGFDAAFVTDHNLMSRESRAASLESRVASHQQGAHATVLCPGIEISAWRAHIVLLGSTVPVDRKRYKGFDGLLALLGSSDSAYGALSLASLPEYRRNHWDRLDRLASAGLDGFEIVNASPKANELTRPEIGRVVDVARRHNRFVAGVSDSHGWGATSMVWNLVRTGGSSPDPCSAVLSRLRTGFTAVRVIERHRLRPDDWWPMWLTPVGVVWETWRSMGWRLTAAWLLWIAAWTLLFQRRAMRSHTRSAPAAR